MNVCCVLVCVILLKFVVVLCICLCVGKVIEFRVTETVLTYLKMLIVCVCVCVIDWQNFNSKLWLCAEIIN